MLSLLKLFSTDRHLLEDRGSFIIRWVRLLQVHAESTQALQYGQTSPRGQGILYHQVSHTSPSSCWACSSSSVQTDISWRTGGPLSSGESHFSKFMLSLLKLFSTDRHLLEDRGSFIIRWVTLLQVHAELTQALQYRQTSPRGQGILYHQVSHTSPSSCWVYSSSSVQTDISWRTGGPLSSGESHFSKFMLSLLKLFSTDRHLLEDRGSFIIRWVTLLQVHAESTQALQYGQTSPRGQGVLYHQVSHTSPSSCWAYSSSSVQTDISWRTGGPLSSGESHFSKFMLSLLKLFSTDRHLLEDRGSFIIRWVTLLQVHAEPAQALQYRQASPGGQGVLYHQVSHTSPSSCWVCSSSSVQTGISWRTGGPLSSGESHFSKFMLSLLKLFSTDRHLLEDRGSFIIRWVTLLQVHAESAQALQYRQTSPGGQGVLYHQVSQNCPYICWKKGLSLKLFSTAMVILQQGRNTWNKKLSVEIFQLQRRHGQLFTMLHIYIVTRPTRL